MFGVLSAAGKTVLLLGRAAVRKSAGIGNPANRYRRGRSRRRRPGSCWQSRRWIRHSPVVGNEIVEGAEGAGFVDMVAAGGRGVAADEVHQAGKRGRIDIHTEPVLHLEKQGGKGVGKRHGADWGYLKSGQDYSQSTFSLPAA